MREYLISFLNEFEYASVDAQYLLCVFDKIAADESAKKLFSDALSAYEANIAVDYHAEIFSRTKRISEITRIHDYTVELLTFMCMTRHLRSVYLANGLDMQIYKDSVLDLKWKLEECKAVKGICGSFVSPWFCGFFDMTRFALGRLQFEIITTWQDYEKAGVKLEADKSRVINVHIPRTGTPLIRKAVIKHTHRQGSFSRIKWGKTVRLFVIRGFCILKIRIFCLSTQIHIDLSLNTTS